MGILIHCRRINGDLRYRLWSTAADAYLTSELTREEVSPALVEVARQETQLYLATRLQRAERQGTSCGIGGKAQALTSSWQTERCETCGTVHHVYVEDDAYGTCRECGEEEDDISHMPECGLGPINLKEGT